MTKKKNICEVPKRARRLKIDYIIDYDIGLINYRFFKIKILLILID